MQSPREGDQVDIQKIKGTVGKEQPDKDGSGGLKVRQESTQLDSPHKVGEELSKKVKGNDCRKRRRTERRERGSRKRTRRVETHSTDSTNKETPILNGTQQMGSFKEERKRRKRRSGHQMVFELTFYTDPA